MTFLLWTARGLTLGPIAFWVFTVVAVIILSGPFDCTIHSGFANPCTVMGHDLSQTAYGLGVFAAWGVFLILPISAAGGLLWALVRSAVRRRARR